MSHPIRLVIFDCDGVLVDSERIAVAVDVVVLAELGWVMTEAEVVERFMGRTDEYMVSQIEAHLGIVAMESKPHARRECARSAMPGA